MSESAQGSVCSPQTLQGCCLHTCLKNESVSAKRQIRDGRLGLQAVPLIQPSWKRRGLVTNTEVVELWFSSSRCICPSGMRGKQRAWNSAPWRCQDTSKELSPMTRRELAQLLQVGLCNCGHPVSNFESKEVGRQTSTADPASTQSQGPNAFLKQQRRSARPGFKKAFPKHQQLSSSANVKTSKAYKHKSNNQIKALITPKIIAYIPAYKR